MRRSELALALALAAPLAFATGCDDDDGGARIEAQKKHDAAEACVKFVESSADDPKQFAEVMKQAAKARVLAWGDNAMLARIEDATAKARSAHNGQLDQVWTKTHEHVQAALAKTDPADADKTCQGALTELDAMAPAVAARAGAKADEDRKALVERIDAARRAVEIVAKAKDLNDESPAKAKAFVKSFEVVPAFKQSPFQSQVLSLLQGLPDKPAGASGGGAAGGGGEELVIFDGSNDAQFTYFAKQHDWTWKVPKPPEEPVLFGDNSESTQDTSSIWLGDETWGDVIVEVQFNVGDGGLQFHARTKLNKLVDETSKDVAYTEDSFDTINLPDSKKGEWQQVRIELKGQKATIRLNGEKSEMDLAQPKGAFGLTLTPGAMVKVRKVKITLLDKDAHRPQMHEEKPKDDDEGKDNPKKKKKKKPAAGTPEAGGDEKKDEKK